MFAKLTGTILHRLEGSIILDVNGVGYLLFCTQHSIAQLAEGQSQASLWVETHVREDHIHLYGFLTQEEQEWFTILLRVNGVGPKMALGILSGLPPEKLSLALAAEDKSAFTAVSGVGPKLATRLVTELKDKAGHFSTAVPASSNMATGAASAGNHAVQDAISALVNLGYGRADAYQTVSQYASAHGDNDVEAMIRHGLHTLGSV